MLVWFLVIVRYKHLTQKFIAIIRAYIALKTGLSARTMQPITLRADNTNTNQIMYYMLQYAFVIRLGISVHAPCYIIFPPPNSHPILKRKIRGKKT